MASPGGDSGTIPAEIQEASLAAVAKIKELVEKLTVLERRAPLVTSIAAAHDVLATLQEEGRQAEATEQLRVIEEMSRQAQVMKARDGDGIEKQVELLQLQLAGAEADHRRWQMELEMWRAQKKKDQMKVQSISEFKAEKEAWLSMSMSSGSTHMLPNREIILGCDMPTGNVAFDKRYIAAKLPRRQALESVYADDLDALLHQVDVLNESQEAKLNVSAQDDLKTVVMALVEADIVARPLTNPQLEKETSQAVLEREARMRGIRLYAVYNDVEEMRRQLSEVDVITGEQIEEVVYEPHVDEARDKMKILGPQHVQGGCKCGGMLRGCEECGNYIGWKYLDVYPESGTSSHEVPSPTCAVDVIGQF